MWQNYFRIALRNLTRNKVQSTLLIGGLANPVDALKTE